MKSAVTYAKQEPDMHIVHVMNWYLPGMGYQENFLPSEQKKLGHDVEVVTSNLLPPYPGLGRHVGRLPPSESFPTGTSVDNEVPIHRLKGIQLRRFVFLRGLGNKIGELDPDVIQLHGCHQIPTLQTLLLSRRIEASIFIDDHSYEVPPTASLWRAWARSAVLRDLCFFGIRVLYRITDDRISGFMPVTPLARDLLRSRFGIGKEKIHLVPLGANTRLFKASERDRTAGREILGGRRGATILISTGKFDETKELDVLLRALHIAIGQGFDLQLFLIGDGSPRYMDMLRNTVAELGLSDKVEFRDFAENKDLPKLYNAADIGCWPGNPTITAIEAAAVGLPVIVPEDDDAYRILLEREAAISFERGDPLSLAQALARLVRDSELRRRISANARQLVETEMSWEKLAQKTIDIYLNHGNIPRRKGP